MMSVERSFEAWEEVQRHGQDFADRLAQGFNGLIHSHITPPSFVWPNPPSPKVDFPPRNFMKQHFSLAIDNSAINGVTAIFDIGNRIGQVGASFGACLNGVVQQFFKRFPFPISHDEFNGASISMEGNSKRSNVGIALQDDVGSLVEKFKGYGLPKPDAELIQESKDDTFDVNVEALKHFGSPQGTVNFTTTYNSRTKNIESSLVARGDLWRVEASRGSSSSGHENPSLFLVQLGPVLFVRDSTFLLPVHLSKQHLLWYGYDRKNGMHSLCPAIWSKHRRWLLMSMICLSPLACSFMDVQFPNGQVTYVSGEGLSTTAFLPFRGGLLQAQGQYPGEMKFSYAFKNKWGTRITPTLQWPDKSFACGLEQTLSWQRSGLMVRPAVQLSLCSTFGGTSPGLRVELTHSVKEQLNLICGCALVARPSAFASFAIGRSKWNGNVGSTGLVVKAETPLSNMGRPSVSVQFNSGMEF